MLNPGAPQRRRRQRGDPQGAREAGIEVKDSNPEFGLTHEKSMVVDDETAFVKSLNWATKNLTETRDYAVVTNHTSTRSTKSSPASRPTGIAKSSIPATDAHLIWCRGNGRERIARFIDDAKHTLFVQNERYQDAVIIERLVRAAVRGVKVHVMARPPHSLKKEKLVEGVGGLRIMDDVGIKIHKLKGLKLHGKMLLADGVRAIVGSINLAPGSFDDRRELAIEVHDERDRRAPAQSRQTRLGKLASARPLGRRTVRRSRRPRGRQLEKSSRSTWTRKRSSTTRSITTTSRVVEGS